MTKIFKCLKFIRTTNLNRWIWPKLIKKSINSWRWRTCTVEDDRKKLVVLIIWFLFFDSVIFNRSCSLLSYFFGQVPSFMFVGLIFSVMYKFFGRIHSVMLIRTNDCSSRISIFLYLGDWQPCSKVPVIVFFTVDFKSENYILLWCLSCVELVKRLKYTRKAMLLLVKCFDIKTVKLPRSSFVGTSPCSWPTKKKFLYLKIVC